MICIKPGASSRAVPYLLFVSLAVQVPVIQAQTSVTGSHACGTFSDYVVSNDSLSPVTESPARIMPSRYSDLQKTIAGWETTGRSLIALENGRLVPAGFSDDPGIYALIPWLARTFHLDLSFSITAFFDSILLLGVLIGCIGVLLLSNSSLMRTLGIAVVLYSSVLAYRTGDVYLLEFSVPMSLVPLALFFVRRQRMESKAFVQFLFVGGLVAGVASLVRSSSSLPTIVFLVLLVLLMAVKVLKKAILVALLLGAFVLPRLYFHHLVSERDSFLAAQNLATRTATSRHIFWHLAYLGMGFLSNPYAPGGICDDAAKAKVHSVRPSAAYLSPEYDRVLRQETIAFVQSHPTLAMFTVFAKLGIIVSLIAIFANIGLLGAIFYPKSLSIEVPFWGALVMASAPLIVAAPIPLYSIGLVAWSVIYGFVSLNWAVESSRLLDRVTALAGAGVTSPPRSQAAEG
jgi:hypothetical protein